MFFVYRKVDGFIIHQSVGTSVVGKSPHLDIIELDRDDITNAELKDYRIQNGDIVRAPGSRSAAKARRRSRRNALLEQRIAFWRIVDDKKATTEQLREAINILAQQIGLRRKG